MNKELEEAIERLQKNKKQSLYNGECALVDIKDLDIVLQALDNNFVPKEVIEKKMIIDVDKLNHSTNGILNEIYKARITLEKELLEEK